MAERPVLVTTEFRGVFFGYAKNTSGENITLSRARNCIYWPSSQGGFAGLAAEGPAKGARIGARAEKAEAERDEKVTDLFDRLRDVEAERDVAESALATARNRALEEAAECVKDCRQWEPECPHAARILSLRIPEAST